MKSVLISAHHGASNGKGFFIISYKIKYGHCIQIIPFDIMISDLNCAHNDVSNDKGFFIIFLKISIWRLHKNNKLRHSEKWSDF